MYCSPYKVSLQPCIIIDCCQHSQSFRDGFLITYFLPQGFLLLGLSLNKASLPGIVSWQTICTFVNWLTEWVCFDNWSLTCILKDSKILEDFYICYKCFFWNIKSILGTLVRKKKGTSKINKLRLETMISIMDLN